MTREVDRANARKVADAFTHDPTKTWNRLLTLLLLAFILGWGAGVLMGALFALVLS